MKRESIDVFLVEDDGVLGGAVAQRLRLEGISVHWVQSVTDGLNDLQRYKPSLLLCDIRLPDGTGPELFKRAGQLLWDCHILFATAYAEIQQAIDLVKLGAADYLIKPYDINELIRTIKFTLTRAPLPQGTQTPLRHFHYEAPEMEQVVSQLKRVAKEKFSVFLVGESGTGKEMAARLVHEASGRSPAPFISISCADITEHLLEIKYFGSDPNPALGVESPSLGVMETVGSGTLFLDDICEMHPKMQVLLSRALQDGGFYRVNGTSFIPFKGRIIAAAQPNFNEALSSGQLRPELYYRLQNTQIILPSLKERVSDIIPLTHHFLKAYGSTNPLAPFDLTNEAKKALVAHNWPGNVRELTNRVVQACTLAHQSTLQAHDFFPELKLEPNTQIPLSEIRAEAEREEIERVIAECEGRISEAAKRLGISRTTLWKRRKKST